ncbi:hypothetical protein AVEN_127834-1 [Araneus ventricosus]|uniref:Uncharacterized protein n=1 Tax=Araneus ventricosus TaxID=182803 RepID=A0A4Y2A0I6_ARAVE|nr:hypothetical protein AVEN_127834-1 [Araneus ventricosus]
MSFLRTVEYNLCRRDQRARESLDERFRRRWARNAADSLRRARAHREQQMANGVNSQVETNVSEQYAIFVKHFIGEMNCTPATSISNDVTMVKYVYRIWRKLPII